MAGINAAEALLENALVAVVGCSWPMTSLSQVLDALSHHYQVTADAVQVCHYQAEAFLFMFHDRQEADRVLHANPPKGADLWLVFRRWRRQARALFKPMFFNVLLSIENILAHIRSVAVA
jgi:hypothetical protein